jgi:transcription elongation factor Elf1
MAFDANEFDRMRREKNKITCPVCGSDNLVKYKEVRDGNQEVEYLCHCSKCGEEGDFADINDKIWYWSQLPVRRRFDHYSDNRDEGGKIEKYRVDYDRGANDPSRIKKV